MNEKRRAERFVTHLQNFALVLAARTGKLTMAEENKGVLYLCCGRLAASSVAYLHYSSMCGLTPCLHA